MSDAARVDGRLRRDATEQKILDATDALLSGGASLAGLSVNRIVEQAGVSRATFYLHFSDKRGLVTRLGQRELAEFTRVTEPLLASPDVRREELADAVEQVIEIWADHAGVLSSLVELAEYDAEMRETWKVLVGAVAERITPVLRQRRPELSAREVSSLAEVVAWMGERTCHQVLGRESTPRERARVAAALTEAIWRIATP